MKNNRTHLLLALVFALLGMRADAITFHENLLFTAKMTGSQVSPAVATIGTGIGSFMLNKKRDSLAVNVAVVGFLPKSAAIYAGKPGVNGSLLLDISGLISGQNISMRIKGATVTGNLAKLLGDGLYLVVGSDTNPAGEIRGQIKLATDAHFVADLTGDELVPAVPSGAFGLGSFALSMDGGRVNFKIVCQSLSGAITGAKLHFGAAGTVGAEATELTAFINGNILKGSFSPSPATLASLFLGEIYLNITTAEKPSGEVRSQLRLQKGLAFEAFAVGQKMVPVVSSGASALGVFRISPSLDTFYFDIVADKISSSIDYSHLHVGNAGQAYDVLQLDFTPNISGNRISGFLKGNQISATSINKLLVSNLTLIVHTSLHPMGELRDQVVRFAHEGFSLRMDGGQVVPPVATGATGAGVVSINREQDRAHYSWVAGGLSGPAVKAEFRNNSIGATGPAVLDLSNKMVVSGNEVSADGAWASTDPVQFLGINALQFEQNKVYLNLTTDANPDGEIRGQVLRGTVFYAPTTAVDDFLGDEKAALTISPNPATDEVRVQIDHFTKEKADIRLSDIYGKTLRKVTVTAISGKLDVPVDLSGLPASLYLLTVSDGANTKTTKVVIGN